MSKKGAIPLGNAVLTHAGKLPYKGIIHVAGINMFWRATKYSIEQSVYSAIKIVNENKFNSVAFPMIGAGTGGFNPKKVQKLIEETLSQCETKAKIYLVIYKK